MKPGQTGMSVVEVILAAALFILFATAAAIGVIGGLNANRQSGEYAVATQYAAEGIEAVRSIKNQSFTNLVNSAGTGIIRNAGNLWEFSGTNNTFDSSRYTRVMKVESVSRDAAPPLGNIVSPGGTLDGDTKKITSTVSWNYNSVLADSVILTTYLSDWIEPLSTTGDGILVYGRSSNLIPRANFYTNSDNTFSANSDTVSGDAGRNFVIKTSPTKLEAVAAYVDSSTLRVMCFDGTTWTNEWNAPVGGTGTTRRFDLTYEHQSGDVMVLYSTNSGTNELDFRTKDGSLGCGDSNWVDQTAFDSPGTTGVVTWVKLTADSRSGSNILAAAWADMNRDLQSAIWDGTTWTQRSSALETTLECRGNCTSAPTIPNGDSFDIDFESVSGQIMVVWGSGGSGTSNGAWYARCDGGAPPACNWSAKTAISGLVNDATSLDISANPASDEIIFGSIGDGGSDFQAAYWSGTGWSGSNDLDATALTPFAGSSLVATGWLINGSTTRAAVIFANAGTTRQQHIHGFVWNGSSFIRQGTDSDTTPWFIPSPLFGSPRWYDIQIDPKNKDKLMFLVSNSVNNLFAKRLEMSATGTFTWSNPTYADGTALETSLVQGTTSPFYFGYWRNP